MGAVFRLTLRQLTGRWRLAIMTVLALLPVLFTMMVLTDSTAPTVQEFEAVVFSTMLAGSIVPLVILSIASVAFANEVEDRTLANLTLSPLPRWQIVAPKLAASVAVAAPFVVGSTFVTAFLAYNRDSTAVLAMTGAAVVSLLMYASMFTWFGLVTKQAIAAGLVYIVLWEGFFSGYVSGIRYVSVRHYAAALAHGFDPGRYIDDPHVGFAVAVAISAAVIGLFLWLATRRLRRMDVP